MKTYYQMIITKQYQPLFKGFEDAYTFDTESIEFEDMEAVKAYISEQYGSCKSQPTYRDTKGGAEVSGVIRSFKANGIESHWIELYKINSERILIK